MNIKNANMSIVKSSQEERRVSLLFKSYRIKSLNSKLY